MNYIVVEEHADAALIADAVASVGEDELSIIVSGKGSGIQLSLSLAVARHAPVALVRSAHTSNSDYVRDQELGFQDFVFDLAVAHKPVLLLGVPDIATSIHDEKWTSDLVDFASSDDFAERNPFEYRR
ncbi:hypothetical protein D3C71_480950 [compost metagenome]